MKQEVARHIEEILDSKNVISYKDLHIENNELEKAIIEEVLEESKSTIAMKITEIEKLNADVQVKNEKISSVEKLIKTLRVEVEELKESEDELKHQETKMYEKFQASENEKQSADAKVSELNGQLSTAKKEWTQKIIQVVEVEAQLVIMREYIQKYAEVKVNFVMLDKEYNVLKERVDSLEQTVKAKSEAIVKLKSEVEANNKMIDELYNNSNQKNSELQTIQQNMNGLEKYLQ